MATGSLAVEVAEGKPAYLGLLAFGSEAEALLQCDKGDAVAVRGRLESNRWISPEGEPREKWQVIADTLLPGPGKPVRTAAASRVTKGTTQGARDFQSPPEPPPYDDEVPF